MNTRPQIPSTPLRRSATAVAIALALGISTPLAAQQKKDDAEAKTTQEARQAANEDGAKGDRAANAGYSDEDWRKLTRSNLRVRVQSALAASESLRGSDIEVEFEERGRVTLSGAVANDEQKQRALRIARTTPGVREVEDNIDVNASLDIVAFEKIDDSDLAIVVAKAIAKEFEGAITKDSWFFGHDVKGKGPDGKDWTVEVLADNGEIELNGELPSNGDIQTALLAARRVPGVRAVDNDLKSEESKLLRRAPLAYRYNGDGPMYRATLVTADGNSRNTLICHVDPTPGMATPVAVQSAARSDMASAEMKEMKKDAEKARKTEKAAARSDDRPEISDEKWRSMSSASMALRVESALAASPSLQASDIEVESDGKGMVTLAGKVNSDRQRERAERIARGTSGVEDVKSNLQIDEGLKRNTVASMDDNQLAIAVAEAIAKKIDGATVKDSWAFGKKVEARTGDNDWSIEVEADSGEVELNGDVPTYEIERTILRATRGVAGVSHVQNDLDADEERMLVNAPDPYRYDRQRTGYRGTPLFDTQHSALGGQLVCQVADASGTTKTQ